MTDGESPVATDGPGVSTSKVHKSGSGFSPGRFTKGKPGRSSTSSSFFMALNAAMSTPTPLMLFKKTHRLNENKFDIHNIILNSCNNYTL